MTFRTTLRDVFAGVVLNALLIAPLCAAQQVDEKQKTPDVVLKSPAGEMISLSAQIGKKPVLLVFWASWCTICRDEIPLLNKLNDGSFKVIAVNEGESAWKTKRYVSMNDIGYQVTLDADGSVAKAFQVPGVPACVVIGKSGQVVYRGMGLPENIVSYAGR